MTAASKPRKASERAGEAKAEPERPAVEVVEEGPILPLHSAHVYAMLRVVDDRFRPLVTVDRRYFFRLDVPGREEPWCAEEVDAAVAWLRAQREELASKPGAHKVLCPVCTLNAEFPEYDEEGNAGEILALSEKCKLIRGELLAAFAQITAQVNSRRTIIREKREADRIRTELESRNAGE